MNKGKASKGRLIILTLLLLFGGISVVYAAGGPKIFRVFEWQYAVQVEPIEVTQLTWPSMTVRPGEPIELVYLIKNYDSQRDWNIVIELEIQGGKGAGLGWTIQEGKTSYLPGKEIPIPADSYRTLLVSLFPPEDMSVTIQIYRTTVVPIG